jgi:hypothetical protein
LHHLLIVNDTDNWLHLCNIYIQTRTPFKYVYIICIFLAFYQPLTYSSEKSSSDWNISVMVEFYIMSKYPIGMVLTAQCSGSTHFLQAYPIIPSILVPIM